MAELMTPLDALMSEEEVRSRYGGLLVYRELQHARRDGEIAYYNLRKGPHYTADQIMDYFERRKAKPCRVERPPKENEKLNGPSSSETTGSDRSSHVVPITATGTTKSDEERAANLLDET